MSVWKQLLLLCLLAVGAYGGYEAYRVYYVTEDQAETDEPDRPVPVETALAETRVLKQTVEAVGTTRAVQSVEIVPEADGRLVEINISPGARVAAGDVLAKLDDTIERADLAEAEARLTEQTQALARIEQLRQTNAVSQATLEEAIARLAEARAQLDRTRQHLADRSIRAPFAGIVGLTDVDLGARVAQGDMITRLDDLNDVVVEFWLPETMFALIDEGQGVVATSVAFPGRVFDGAVAAVDSRIDPVSRAFRTRAVIPNPDNTLPAGMFMSLTLTLSQAEALVVPEEAIVFQAGEAYVFAVDDGMAARRPVTTGQRRNGVVAITSGLEPGAEIVIRGLQSVRDGNQVEVLDNDQTTEAGADASDGGS